MALQLLKKLGHEHGILAAGNTHGDFVPALNHVVSAHRLGEFGKQPLVIRLAQALFNLGAFFCVLLPLHFPHQPAHVAFLQAVGLQPLFPQALGRLHAVQAPGAVQHDFFVPGKGRNLRLQPLLGNRNRPGQHAVIGGVFVANIHQQPLPGVHFVQFRQRQFHFFRHMQPRFLRKNRFPGLLRGKLSRQL